MGMYVLDAAQVAGLPSNMREGLERPWGPKIMQSATKSSSR